MNMKKKRVSRSEFEKLMNSDLYCDLTQAEKDLLHDYFVNYLSVNDICKKYHLKHYRVRRLLQGAYGNIKSEKQQEQIEKSHTQFNLVAYHSYVGNITAQFVLKRGRLYGFSQREIRFLLAFFVEQETMYNIIRSSAFPNKVNFEQPTTRRELETLFKRFVEKINEDGECPHPLAETTQLPVEIKPEYAAWDCHVFHFTQKDYAAICAWLPFQNLSIIPKHLRERSFLSFFRAFFIARNQSSLTISKDEIAAERSRRKKLFMDIEQKALISEYQKSLIWLIDGAHAPIKAVAYFHDTSHSHIHAMHQKGFKIFQDNENF